MHLAPHHRAYFVLFIAANCSTYFRVYPRAWPENYMLNRWPKPNTVSLSWSRQDRELHAVNRLRHVSHVLWFVILTTLYWG